MTAPNNISPGRVNFLQLADECRVIRTSPAWSEVARTLEWIEQTERAGEAVDVTDERLGQLKQFADLINESSATIAAAILCGTAVGMSIEEGPRGEKIHRGLRAISNAYHFDQTGDEGVVSALQKVRALLTKEFLSLSLWALRPPIALGDGEDPIDDWQKRLEDDLKALEDELKDRRYDMPRFQQEAWAKWSDHLARAGATSNAASEPTFAELCCAATDIAPTSIIGFDASKVSLFGWGALLRYAIANPNHTPIQGPLDQSTGRIMSVPSRLEWVIPVALHAAGFRMPEGGLVERLSRLQQPTEIARQTIEKFPWLLRGTPPTTSVLLLSLDVDSIAKKWLPQDNVAILVFPQTNGVDSGEVFTQGGERLLWVGSDAKNGSRVPLSLTHVVFEMSNTSKASTEVSEAAFQIVRESFGLPAVRLYSDRPKGYLHSESTIIASDVADFTTQLLRMQQSL